MSNAVIGALRVIFGADTAAFEKGTDEVQRRMAQTQKKLDSMGERFTSIGKKLSIGLTIPLAAFGTSAFNAASDAEELQATFDSTFGQMSGTMNKWAEDTGNALGRSTQEMQKAANTFGMFFNQAVDPRKAAEMSQIFSGLAQDLGSFFNVDTDVAIQKLRSGLSGESEPLRDFGVFLTEATVKAKGLEMGLGGVSGELTEQEKILVRYQLIMDATAKAQGAATREAGSAAGRIRAAKAAFEELQVVVGTKLLPVLTPLIDKLASALNWFVGLPQPIQNTIIAIGAFSAALGPVLTVVGQLLPLLTKLGPVLSIVGKALLFIAANPVILALAGVIAGIYLAWKNWDKIEPIIRNLYNGVKTWLVDKMNAVWNWLLGKIKAVKDAFFNLYDAVVGHSYIPDMVDEVGDHMRRLQQEMVDPALKANDAVDRSFAGMAQSVTSSLQSVIGSIKSGDWLGAVQSVVGALGQFGVFGGGGGGNAAITTGQWAGGGGDPMAGFKFGGWRAKGGPVKANRGYIVGENGPEYMVPKTSGHVVPNHMLGKAGNDNGGSIAKIVPSPYFDVVVDGRVVQTGAPMVSSGIRQNNQAQAFRASRRVA